jgi:predicted short-subunit dehydrogenase-like oxidoreductase (DUF2520 family)
MSKPEIRKVVIVGAGRLAVNLSMAIHHQGYEIVEVCNRTELKGKSLAGILKAKYIPEPEMITPEADLYILAVSDAAIPLLLERIKTRGLVIHTSGSVPMDVLRHVTPNYGVLYPPQTFNIRTLLRFTKVPLCIEASSGENLRLLKSFADSLSEKVYMINSGQRRILHLSAVFASNFSNYMVAISEALLLENGIDFGILEPIIRQTSVNASKGGVFKKQTGPAVRGDSETIRQHLELLSNHPDYKEIYTLITRNIIQYKMKS